MNQSKLIKIGMILLLLLLFSACSQVQQDTKPGKESPHKTVELEEKEEIKPEVIEQEITLSAIGDMLIHSRVYNDAKVESGYDFVPIFKEVQPYLNDTTISFANQETMIGGVELGLSTYPSFNSPKEVGDALKEVGVNIVSVANNHTLDRGEAVIQSALAHWSEIGMMYVGSYKDQADRETVRIFEADEGVSVAFLAYTYGTNGIPIPNGKDFLVNIIDKDVIARDVAEAKELADAVILSLHFGTEYERLPNQAQTDLVQFAADLEVDAVLGHHPHVLQPVDWVTGKNGNKMFVVYSLGNFISGQEEFHRRVGGVVKFTIHKTMIGDKKSIEIRSPKFMPTYVLFQNIANYEVVPMFKLTNNELANAASQYQGIKTHMSQWMPELEFIEE